MKVTKIEGQKVFFDNGEKGKKDRNNLWLYENDNSPWETRRWVIIDGKKELVFEDEG